MMAIDLSALDGFDEPLAVPTEPSPQTSAVPNGKPLDIPLADIEEDPNQPRKKFAAEAMAEMVASVQATGVRSPVSLRPHPTVPNRWILNYGARRYRASLAAGKDTIPAFVDTSHSDYDQVIENLLRDDLTPMELADFIQSKLDEGESKSTIAKRLSRSPKFITIHLALVDLPAPLASVYSEGKTQSPEIIYNLRGLAEKYPEQVAAWVASRQEITRVDVAELTQQLTGKSKGGGQEPKATGAGTSTGGQGGGLSTEKIRGDEEGKSTGGSTADKGGDSKGDGGPPAPDAALTIHKLPPHNPAHETALNTKNQADPGAIKKAVLLVVYDDRPAMVLLNRRPSTQGLLHIKYEDNGEEVEVDAGRCVINCLIEASA